MANHLPIRSPSSAEIPDKLYFRIGEVARLCDVPAYVLRFWESEFPNLKPNKGGTGQRLFRRRDVEIALRIKRLLYDEGYTIPGARQLLKVEGKQKEPQLTLLSDDPVRAADRETQLRSLRQDLQSLLTLLQAAPRSTGALAFRSDLRQPISTPAARRSSLLAVPANENLFDFPAGVSSAPVDLPEPEKDPL
jgi:DNA-binding transcriptional MerR regulator